MTADPGARAEMPEHLVVGYIARAHGTRGELFVMPLTDSPDDVFVADAELLLGNEDGEVDDDSSVITIEEVRSFKRGFLLRITGVESRDEADSLAQLYLLAPAAALPPLEEDEVYYHELLGLTVETTDGVPVGRVREVYETVPHHLLEVEDDDGKRRLIPYTDRIITQLDRATRRLIINPPEGLLEL
jgi:16S rRNA processing protein RimM